MYTVLFKTTCVLNTIVAVENENSLFVLISVLEDSKKVVAYKVFMENIKLESKHFGWGKFDKWL